MNFHTSQLKCDMRMLHYVTVMILYCKSENFSRANDKDMFLMWMLVTHPEDNWVKFFIDQVIICKCAKSNPMFYTSFIKLILERNNIVYIESYHVDGSKLFDDTAVKPMHYHCDNKGGYFHKRPYVEFMRIGTYWLIKLMKDMCHGKPLLRLLFIHLISSIKAYVEVFISGLFLHDMLREDNLLAKLDVDVDGACAREECQIVREEKAAEEACEKEARKEEAATTRKERSSFQFEFIKEVVA